MDLRFWEYLVTRYGLSANDLIDEMQLDETGKTQFYDEWIEWQQSIADQQTADDMRKDPQYDR